MKNGTVGERLRWAIEERRWQNGEYGSIRSFSKTVQERPDLKGKGRSYQMIHRYLDKDAPEAAPTPPLEFLVAASEVLGVRPEWLLLGTGAPTEAEQNSRERQSEEQEEWLLEEIASEFPLYRVTQDWARRVMQWVQQGYFLWLYDFGGRDADAQAKRPADDIDQELATRFGKIFSHTFDTLEIRPEHVSSRQVSDFVGLFGHAIRAVLDMDPTLEDEQKLEVGKSAAHDGGNDGAS